MVHSVMMVLCAELSPVAHHPRETERQSGGLNRNLNVTSPHSTITDKYLVMDRVIVTVMHGAVTARCGPPHGSLVLGFPEAVCRRCWKSGIFKGITVPPP